MSPQHTKSTYAAKKLSFGSVFSFQSRNEGEVPGEVPNHYLFNNRQTFILLKTLFQNLAYSLEPFNKLLTRSV